MARVIGILTDLISNAQNRGAVRVCGPKHLVISIMGPMMMSLPFHEVFESDSPYAQDFEKLATQHSGCILKGIMLNNGT